jgi:Protein of unknown function (DUF1428)
MLIKQPANPSIRNNETVCFSWIVWPSREVRNEGMKKVMVDPRMQPEKNQNTELPFDGKRMTYGGFEMMSMCSFCEIRFSTGKNLIGRNLILRKASLRGYVPRGARHITPNNL